MYSGFLAESDLDYSFAVIEVNAYLDVHVVVKHALDILPHGEELLAVGHGCSGKLMARTVNFSGDLRASEDDVDPDYIVPEVPLNDNANVLFCVCYYMCEGSKSYFYFICNSYSIALHFVQM